MITRSSFDQALMDLNHDVVELGAITVEILEKTKVALLNLDVEKANEIIKGDKAIDDREMNILETSMSIIIKEQPVASDLRFLIVALRIGSELERICDHSAQIAKLTRKLVKHNGKTTDLPSMIENLFDLALDMVRRIVKAYATGDVEMAKNVYVEDDRLDKNYKSMLKIVKGELEKNPDETDLYIDYIFISKYFERIGDRTNAIAEQIYYKETGEFLTFSDDD